MKVRLTLRPGQKGTKALLRQHGDRLVCVRYRYDAERCVSVKTAEIVVEERPWVSQLMAVAAARRPVLIAIEYRDAALRRDVKAAGGVWRPELGLWELRLDEVRRLNIEGFVVQLGARASTPGCRSASANGKPT